MITGTVRSAELFATATAVDELLADPAVAFADTADEFDRRAHTWLREHYPTNSAGFTDWVTKNAWIQRAERQARLEITVTELGAIVMLLGQSPSSPATESLTTKINELAARMGFACPLL